MCCLQAKEYTENMFCFRNEHHFLLYGELFRALCSILRRFISELRYSVQEIKVGHLTSSEADDHPLESFQMCLGILP